MAKTNGNAARQQETVDGETGEILGAADDATVNEMFGDGEGTATDGTITVGTITAKRVNAHPERGTEQPSKIFAITGTAVGTEIQENAEKTQSFVALKGDFGAVVYDNAGEPVALFKADTCYFPIGQAAALVRLDKAGMLGFSLEFWTRPAANPSGYQWYAHNLAKIDANNLSTVDRLLIQTCRESKLRSLPNAKPPLLLTLARGAHSEPALA